MASNTHSHTVIISNNETKKNGEIYLFSIQIHCVNIPNYSVVYVCILCAERCGFAFIYIVRMYVRVVR